MPSERQPTVVDGGDELGEVGVAQGAGVDDLAPASEVLLLRAILAS